MFNPEMMAAAQNMMANMKPEDMQRMSEFAAKMDPKTMENMMSSMGGAPNGMDAKQMSEQMKNMTPEQMRAGMNQAQNQMGAQKQYVYNGALHLKNEGNNCIKKEEYSKALESYDRAIENLRPHSGDDVKTLRLQLLSNAALCHLKGKTFRKALEVCDEALKLDPKAFKPLYRRGLAHEGMGDVSQALSDVKTASSLSPEDKAITAELTRLRKIAEEKGIKEEDLKPKEPPAASSSPTSSASTGAPKSFSPGGSTSSSTASPSMSGRDMSQAMDEISKNPEMLTQAAEMMKNMSPEDISRMMPGADPEAVKQSMQNPDMFKNAMEKLKAMPEDDRKRMLESASSMQKNGMPDMSKGDLSSMSSVFENPDMMQHVAEMAKSQEGVDPEQADMMRKAAEQIQQNPELGKQMSEMIKNMPPEQMQKMMEMSAAMKGRGKGQGGGGGDGGPVDPMAAMNDPAAYDQFLNDPQMMKAAEDMMKSMSPETLASMAKSSGIDMGEGQAKMLGKMMPYMPYLLKCMRAFGYVRRGFKTIFSSKGKVLIAFVVLTAAVVQHCNSK